MGQLCAGQKQTGTPLHQTWPQRPPDFDQVILLLPLLARVFLNYTSFIFIKKGKTSEVGF